MKKKPMCYTSPMFRIRTYQDEDCAAVWNLHNAALLPTGGHAGNGDWDDDLHHIPAVYFDRGGTFVVGLLKDQIIAMGGLERCGPDAAEVRRMRVAPNQQRKNFGQKILRHLELTAIEWGLRRLYLETTTKQQAAQQFYIRNGYRESSRRTIAPFEVIRFEKNLNHQTG
ncbi:GNAT family N-acetyltransferase [Pontiella agarivorans]|uniref:GNAT family N-acetyltransferase n=1 Tax=Pontiella agarivorans TaxID=3038953 RepID=A0ABU5MX14_9BACT|nr:GNAT family N-acetyltransferase [Pontiella agarivorans]MDZ8118745.1 GNAT family N-acetyltransferase [Pontiella agarivorans]